MKLFDTPEEEEVIRHIPFFEKDGVLYLTCISPDVRYSYAHLQDGTVVFSSEETEPSGIVTLPPELPADQYRGTINYIVGFLPTDVFGTDR